MSEPQTHKAVTLRTRAGIESVDDLKVMVQEKTYDYLMTSAAPTMRVSAYLDEDQSQVAAQFAEIFLTEECPYHSLIETVIPGSRTRQGIVLPAEMKTGEQLTLIVKRHAKV